MFPLLNCCAEVTVKRLGKFLIGLVPGGDALIEVVEFGAEVWERWTKQKPDEAARREELQALAHASPERVEAAVQAAVQAEAAGQPATVKRKLTTYLTEVQVAVRRTVLPQDDHEGRTVPADLSLNSAEELLPFLPSQLPRFEPGELISPPAPMPAAPRASGATPIRFACPVCKTAMKAPAQNADQKLNCPKCGQRIQIPPPRRGTILAESLPPEDEPILERRRPPRRGVPMWVWLGGGAVAVVVGVVVALAMRGGPKPTHLPVAAKGPGDADKSKDTEKSKNANKPKDAEPDRKKDKKDKTDTPEKPSPLPRLVAFSKLSLPERGVADLQVKVERQGYAGPIKVQVENLPPGVTCQRAATVPVGESELRLEFQTDGTAAEGTATVEVIALADARTADRQKLSLVVPPQLPKDFKNSLGMEFVRIPKGKSWLGGGGGNPGNKEVTIRRDFYLGRYEVTQQEWEKVVGVRARTLAERNPSYFSRGGKGKAVVQGVPDNDLKRFPVENVSYEDAKAFVAELNKRCKDDGWVYRLPTEAEWEYACRGGPMMHRQESTFDWYFKLPTNELKKEQANFDLQRPCKVGSYPPNRLGLHDMHGNVWEWCDNALADLPGPQAIDKGAASGIVERGGCWHDGPQFRPLSARISFPPSYRSNDHGLRVARVPDGAEKK